MMVVKCCGYCEHHKKDDSGEWACECEDSECYGFETDFEDVCDEFERR